VGDVITRTTSRRTTTLKTTMTTRISKSTEVLRLPTRKGIPPIVPVPTRRVTSTSQAFSSSSQEDLSTSEISSSSSQEDLSTSEISSSSTVYSMVPSIDVKTMIHDSPNSTAHPPFKGIR
jgi:hypothetical protein